MKKIINYFHDNYGMKWFYLLIIILIAFFLRIFYLDKIPLGMYADELSIAYNAYCIAETGKDEFGQFLPIFSMAYGVELTDPVMLYITAFFIKIFGPSVFAARFTSCFLGLLTVFFTYKLCELYFPKSVALLASFLLAISPYHIHFSRIAMGNITVPAFIVMSLYVFSLGLKRNSRYITLSAVPMGLTAYTYSIAQLFGPLLYSFLFIFNLKKILQNKQSLIIFILIIGFILMPIINFYSKRELPRFNVVSIANPTYSLSKEEGNIKNKSILLTSIFIRNYFKHMSFDFLLNNGDRNLRHHIGGQGQIMYFTFFMTIVGFFYLLFKKPLELYIFPTWFLLFPVPAALTWESLPHAGRTICGLPIFEILAAVGTVFLLSNAKNMLLIKKKVIGLTIYALVASLTIQGISDYLVYLKKYLIDFPKNATAWFDYDIYAISKATENMKDYDQIILPIRFTNVHFLFLQKINPKIWLENKNILQYVYEKDYKDDYTNYNKKIAAVVRPGQYSYYKTIGYVRHELTGEVMYEIKEVNMLPVKVE